MRSANDFAVFDRDASRKLPAILPLRSAVEAPSLLQRRGVERNRRVGRGDVHQSAVDDRVGVKRAHVPDLEHGDRPQRSDVLTVDLLQVHEALTSIVVIRQQPVGRVGGRRIQLRLSWFG